MATQITEGTFPLDELNELTVAKDDPDPRGWDVVSSDNRKVGEVRDLLVDVRAMKVRYLDVELDKDLVGQHDRHVLFPIGTAWLDEEEDRVMVRIDASRALEMPIYRKDGAVKREYEDSILTTMGMGASMAAGAGIDPDVYYQRPEFETGDFYGKRSAVSGGPSASRRITAGEIELRKALAKDTDDESISDVANEWHDSVEPKTRAMDPGESGRIDNK